MNVTELNEMQLDELRETLFNNNVDKYGMYKNYYAWYDIPEDEIFTEFAGIEFVNDDFWCTAGINEIEKDIHEYDSKQDIEKCLNCQKSKCNNCLRFINGV